MHNQIQYALGICCTFFSFWTTFFLCFYFRFSFALIFALNFIYLHRNDKKTILSSLCTHWMRLKVDLSTCRNESEMKNKTWNVILNKNVAKAFKTFYKRCNFSRHFNLAITIKGLPKLIVCCVLSAFERFYRKLINNLN